MGYGLESLKDYLIGYYSFYDVFLVIHGDSSFTSGFIEFLEDS